MVNDSPKSSPFAPLVSACDVGLRAVLVFVFPGSPKLWMACRRCEFWHAHDLLDTLRLGQTCPDEPLSNLLACPSVCVPPGYCLAHLRQQPSCRGCTVIS
jgi:hypothetical protein